MDSPTTVRPSGTVGRVVKARTNAFELTWSERSSVHHYDVAISPLWEPVKSLKIGARKGIELVMRLQEDTHPNIFQPPGAYDGKKNLFSFHQFNFTAEEFRVPWDRLSGHQGSQQSLKFASVKIVYVRAVNVGVLRTLLKGRGNLESLRPEGDVSTSLNMLNIFVQAAPRMAPPRIHNSKSFFVPHSNDRLSGSIWPLELWRGYFQSVRPTFDRIIVNIDVTVGAIVPAASLESLCANYLGLRNSRDLARLNYPDFHKLRQFIRGLKIDVDLAGHKGRRPKTIKDLVRGVGEQEFDTGNGQQMTVAEHFQRAHNRFIIHPGSLGVKVGHSELFPLTACRTVAQLYKNRLSPEGVSKMLQFSPKNPELRIQEIQKGWEYLRHQQSHFLHGAGITISPKPLEVQGRLLFPPDIAFQTNLHLTRPGVWDVVGKRLAQPVSIPHWTVVNFGGERVEISILNRFVNDLTTAMRERGMRVADTHGIKSADPGDAEKTLFQEGYGCKAQLILVILPENVAPLYTRVKRWGDILQGVVTQCVRWTGKIKDNYSAKSCNQYHNNLILKINAKMGGLNWLPQNAAMKALSAVPSMVLGADVSHPGPGSLLPSVTALVSSYDPYASRYIASTKVQQSRMEIIKDLEAMVVRALKVFQKKNKSEKFPEGILPRRLFFYRDGVSEGEFQTVRVEEIPAIGRAIRTVYGPHKSTWPGLTFFVVGKRHHVRFFPENGDRDQQGNNNCYSGFVVDRDIVHPVHPDFYLQSHPGLKGTSRPGHYTVLRDDNKGSPDGYEELSYLLCHCYSRCTRAVRIPAPVYYADLVCRRAKFHFDDQVNYSDDVSVHSDESSHMDFYEKHFQEINERMKDVMYFL